MSWFMWTMTETAVGTGFLTIRRSRHGRITGMVYVGRRMSAPKVRQNNPNRVDSAAGRPPRPARGPAFAPTTAVCWATA